MWRLSPRRWTVMPSAPASSARTAAATGSGSGACRRTREELEPALRVAKRKAGQRADREIEQTAGRLADPRLVHHDLGALDRPRTDRDRRLPPADRLGQLAVLIDRRRKVRVGEEHLVPTRLEHAVPDAVPLSPVPGVRQQAKLGCLREAGDETAHYVRRPVGRSVVDDQDLGGNVLSRDEGEDALQRRDDARSLVVGGDDDREAGRSTHLDSTGGSANRRNTFVRPAAAGS